MMISSSIPVKLAIANSNVSITLTSNNSKSPSAPAVIASAVIEIENSASKIATNDPMNSAETVNIAPARTSSFCTSTKMA
jgi:hypothetical protein